MTKMFDVPDHYVLPVVRPDWAELLADWQPLISGQLSPWLLTKFGELFFCQPDGKIGMLQISGFQYQIVAKDRSDFQKQLAHPDKMAYWFLVPFVDRLELAGKRLEPEKCFSFIRPLALGGELTVENVMIVPIREHFRCCGELFRQIKNMPDGGQVVIKVT